jgi:hypothetical protein
LFKFIVCVLGDITQSKARKQWGESLPNNFRQGHSRPVLSKTQLNALFYRGSVIDFILQTFAKPGLVLSGLVENTTNRVWLIRFRHNGW